MTELHECDHPEMRSRETSDDDFSAHLREAHDKCGSRGEFLGRQLFCFLLPGHEETCLRTVSGFEPHDPWGVA
jgi:hypothetical protein